jgi:hypothetical protein
MRKKCPPGVMCVENYSLFFLIIGICILGYSVFRSQTTQKVIINESTSVSRENVGVGFTNWGLTKWLPSWPYTNLPGDPLLNPYSPPLRDERYFTQPVPINVSTNIGAVDTQYRQVGILNATNTTGKIIPLMGRPLFTNRNKWQYYTMSDQNNSIKLPLSRNGKSCTNEYGCDKLDNGDSVYIEGLNEPYRITVYDNDTIKYLPFV